MPDVYEGKPDERQSTDPNLKPSRFRPRYRQLQPEEVVLHDAIKSKAVELETLIESVKNGQSTRYKALAMTSLEEAIMWAVKELTA